jgi:hypothetical protein
VPATWHASEAVQVTFVQRLIQAPFWQTPFGQVVPFGRAGLLQAPVVGSQVPAPWHASEAVQITGVPAQTPLVQMSLWVQGFPSLQAVPLRAAGLLHSPVLGSQVPAEWH